MEAVQMQEIGEIKEWNLDEFIKYCLLKVLHAATENVLTYTICVMNLENLLSDELPTSYVTDVGKEKIRLWKEIGDLEDPTKIRRESLLAAYKFKLLLSVIKKKIPKERVGGV